MAEDAVVLTDDTIEAARGLVLSTYLAGKTLSEELKSTEVDPIMAAMLAYGSLFLACCKERDVAPMSALMSAEACLGSRPTTSTSIH